MSRTAPKPGEVDLPKRFAKFRFVFGPGSGLPNADPPLFGTPRLLQYDPKTYGGPAIIRFRRITETAYKTALDNLRN